MKGTPNEPERDTVHEARGNAGKPRCPATLNVEGRTIRCENETSHFGFMHSGGDEGLYVSWAPAS